MKLITQQSIFTTCLVNLTKKLLKFINQNIIIPTLEIIHFVIEII